MSWPLSVRLMALRRSLPAAVRSSLRMVLDDTSLLIRKGAMEQFIVEVP